MDSPQLMRQTAEYHWGNYQRIMRDVNLEFMEYTHQLHTAADPARIRDSRIATWLAHQSYIVSAWALWEFYARRLVARLPAHANKPAGRETVVGWIAGSLTAAGTSFTNKDWFEGMYQIRNCIAHHGCFVRVPGVCDPPEFSTKLGLAKRIYPSLEVFRDGYLELTHDMSADLKLHTEDFVDETAACFKAHPPSSAP